MKTDLTNFSWLNPETNPTGKENGAEGQKGFRVFDERIGEDEISQAVEASAGEKGC